MSMTDVPVEPHRHGPDCGHVAVHHYASSGESHLAFLHHDATSECFKIEQTSDGCCNMKLIKVPENTCTIEHLFDKQGNGVAVVDADDHTLCAKHLKNETLVEVGRGNGMILLMDQEKNALLVEKEDFCSLQNQNSKETETVFDLRKVSGLYSPHVHPKVSTDQNLRSENCPVFAVLKPHAVSDHFCKNRFILSSPRNEVPQEHSHKHEHEHCLRVSSTENPHLDSSYKLQSFNLEEAASNDIFPSFCTGLWNMVFHSVNCYRLLNHTVVPLSPALEPEATVKLVTSVLKVGDMCCSIEARLVEKLLNEVNGIVSCTTDIALKTTKIRHDPYIVSAKQAARCLNDAKLGATVSIDGSFSNKVDEHELNKSAVPQEVEIPVLLPHGKTLRCGHHSGLKSFGVRKIRNNMPSASMCIALFCLVASLLQYVEKNKEIFGYFKYLALISVAICLPDVFLKSISRLRHRVLDISTLMTLACIGAIALNEYTEAAAVITLYLLSDYLEKITTKRIQAAVSELISLRPTTAIVKLSGSYSTTSPTSCAKAVEEVKVGEVVNIREGDRIPLDGIIEKGSTFIDESALTGEYKPVRKQVGDEVFSGTINVGGGFIEMKVTKVCEDSVVSKMLKLVEEASNNRSQTEQFVEKVSFWYTPIVFSLALSFAVFPWIISVETGKEFAKYGLVLLVIGCPCALVISTPLTYVAGLAEAARNGILIKGGAHLETLGRISNVALDKTGTITEGNFKLLEHLITKPFSEESIHSGLSSMLSLKCFSCAHDIYDVVEKIEAKSSHPIAIALSTSMKTLKKDVTALKAEGESIEVEVANFETIKGQGVKALIFKTITFINDVNSQLDSDVSDESSAFQSLFIYTLALKDSFIELGETLVAESLLNVRTWALQVHGVKDIVLQPLGSSQSSEELHPGNRFICKLLIESNASNGIDTESIIQNVLAIFVSFNFVVLNVEIKENIEECQDGCCNKRSNDYSDALKPVDVDWLPEIASSSQAMCAEESENSCGCCSDKRSLPSSETAFPHREHTNASDAIFLLLTNYTKDKLTSENLGFLASMLTKSCGVNPGVPDEITCYENKKGNIIVCSLVPLKLQVVLDTCEALSMKVKLRKARLEYFVYLGNDKLASDLGWLNTIKSATKDADLVLKINNWQREGFSYCILGGNRNYTGLSTRAVAAFCVGDQIRSNAIDAINSLKQLNINVKMLTGDNYGAAKVVSEMVGLGESFASKLLPEDKLQELLQLKSSGTTAMVGDGINDALSMATADVSIAMGKGGTALAIETADVALMDDNLMKVSKAIVLGRRCLWKIRFNVAFSIIAKVVVILVSLIIPFPNLWLAIGSDVGAMLIVSLNSMSILSRK